MSKANIKLNRLGKQGCQRGFTLVELMTAVAILAIIAVYGIPTFSDFVTRKQVSAVVSEISTSVQQARSQAITTGRNVGICASSNGTTCSGVNDLSNGWMVYMGTPTNVIRVIQVYNKPSNVTITLAGNPVVTPSGMGDATGFNVKVVPTTGNAALAKTMTFSPVALSLTVTDGA